MLTPPQFLKLINKEIHVIIQLSKQVQPAALSYRPKENMRSVQELMQYLTGCGYNYAAFWNTDGSLSAQDYFKQVREKSIPATLENFESLMLSQQEKIKALVDGFSLEDWQHKIVTYPWGEEAPLGEAMVETSLKWLTAYKYQLMMYIKMSTETPLSTKETWTIQSNA